MFLKKALAVGILAAPILAMTGCGGDESTMGSTPSNTSSASLTLALTDGPVDTATAVVIEVTGVSIKPKDGDVIEVTFDEPKSIDLLQLQDGVVTDLVNELALEAGEYAWVQVHINAVKDGVMDSYVEFEDGTSVELNMPGESEHGLRIARSFTLAEGEDATFTIDFDLRKSLIHRAQGPDVTLKPVLHMVPNHHAGHLHGDLDSALVADMCADPSVELGAVYVFAGADATPTDVNGSESDPVASALVKVGPRGEYHYHVGFLEAGEYTVAYTCDAASDNPEEVNELSFAVLEPITIEAREEHEHPFPPTAPHEMWDESVCDLILGSDDTTEEPVADTEDGDVSDDTTTSAEEGEMPEMGPAHRFPPHLKDWCERGDHEWMPRPGHEGEDHEHPMPPVDAPEHPEMPVPPADGEDHPKPPMPGADDDADDEDDGMSDSSDDDSSTDEDEEESDDTAEMVM